MFIVDDVVLFICFRDDESNGWDIIGMMTITRTVGGVSFLIVLVWAVLLHVSYLVVNGLASTLLGLQSPEWIAVVLLASQKTLPVTVSILSFLPESLIGQEGLVAIPPIVGHISQLMIDSFIASYWASRYSTTTTNTTNTTNDNNPMKVSRTSSGELMLSTSPSSRSNYSNNSEYNDGYIDSDNDDDNAADEDDQQQFVYDSPAIHISNIYNNKYNKSINTTNINNYVSQSFSSVLADEDFLAEDDDITF